tara:strand:- start:178 stop:363 length:186 start_codon:yes stop_codon:yes gene_type:complete
MSKKFIVSPKDLTLIFSGLNLLMRNAYENNNLKLHEDIIKLSNNMKKRCSWNKEDEKKLIS